MRDHRERQRHRQREKQAPCRKSDVGLDPGTPGSHLGLKAGTKLLSHPGCPGEGLLISMVYHASSPGSVKQRCPRPKCLYKEGEIGLQCTSQR